MPRISIATALMTTALTAPMAMADVTAQDVWDNLVTAGDMYGEQFSGTLTKNGNVTTVTDMAVNVVLPDGVFSVSIGGMSMTERNDGSVLMQIDASSAFALKGEMPSIGESFAVTGTLTQSGFDAVATGTPGNVTYTYAVPSADLKLSDLAIEADGMDDDVTGDVTISVGVTEFNSVYTVATTAGLQAKGNANYGGLTLDVAADVTEDGETANIKLNLDVADILGTFNFALSEKAAAPDLPSLIAAGIDMVYSFTSGGSDMTLDVQAPGEQFSLKIHHHRRQAECGDQWRNPVLFG